MNRSRTESPLFKAADFWWIFWDTLVKIAALVTLFPYLKKIAWALAGELRYIYPRLMVAVYRVLLLLGLIVTMVGGRLRNNSASSLGFKLFLTSGVKALKQMSRYDPSAITELDYIRS